MDSTVIKIRKGLTYLKLPEWTTSTVDGIIMFCTGACCSPDMPARFVEGIFLGARVAGHSMLLFGYAQWAARLAMLGTCIFSKETEISARPPHIDQWYAWILTAGAPLDRLENHGAASQSSLYQQKCKERVR